VAASEGQRSGDGVISVPLNASGVMASADFSYVDYRKTDDFGRLAGLEGSARYAGLGFDYAVHRAREANLRLSGRLNWKSLVDESIAGRLQDKRAHSGTLGISGDRRDGFSGGAFTGWSLTWTYGDLDLSRVPSALAVDDAGLQTQGKFHRLNASLQRLQNLPGNFSLLARAYGQWANENLDSSEDFALGGPYGVRGWPISEGRGDQGYLGTLELRYDARLPGRWGVVQPAVFLDSGRIWINEDARGVPGLTACGCNDYSLSSAGAGFRWSRNSLHASVSYAHGLGDNPGRSAINATNADGSTSSHQLWLQGTIQF
jgi:hemolysin activation/secretion protein